MITSNVTGDTITGGCRRGGQIAVNGGYATINSTGGDAADLVVARHRHGVTTIARTSGA